MQQDVAGSGAGDVRAGGVLRRLAEGADRCWGDVPFAEEYLSIIEPYAPNFDDRGRGEAAVAIRSVA